MDSPYTSGARIMGSMKPRMHQIIFSGTPQARRFALIFYGGLGCLALLSPLIDHLATTPEQRAVIADREKAAADKDAQGKRARAEKDRWLCHQKTYCASYTSARQECATAGSYDLCMSIKASRKTIEGECDNDGGVGYGLRDQVPNPIHCFLLDHFE